jgi:replicative DNA helicase
MSEVEEVLIGRLLARPEDIATHAGQLNASDFTSSILGTTWATMQRLAAAGRSIDLLTLRAEGVDPGDPTRLLASHHTASLDEYVAIIRRTAFKRRVIQSLGTLATRVGMHDEPADILGDIQSTVGHILTDAGAAGELVTLSAIASQDDAITGLRWGLDALDAATEPAQPGNVYVIAARPSIGKTALAQVIAESWSFDAQVPVLFVSLEMSAQQIRKRALKHHEVADLRAFNLAIYDEPRATTGLLRAQAARIRLRHGTIRGIVVDYLQLLKDHGEPENIRVARMSGECKAIAREFACPVLLLSQLNRQSEGRSDGRPRLNDLRDSGAIEQDADVVFGLWREKRSSPYLDIIGLKNRHGSADWTVRLDFDLDGASLS